MVDLGSEDRLNQVAWHGTRGEHGDGFPSQEHKAGYKALNGCTGGATESYLSCLHPRLQAMAERLVRVHRLWIGWVSPSLPLGEPFTALSVHCPFNTRSRQVGR